MKPRIIFIIISSSAFFLGNVLKAQIAGPAVVTFGSTYQYTEPTVSGHPVEFDYSFEAIGGIIVSGQTQTTVSVIWNIASEGTVQKWKYSRLDHSLTLFQFLNVTVQNTPATGYTYDLAGNRTNRQTIILNPSGLKSFHSENPEDTVDIKAEKKIIIEEQVGNLSIKIYPNPTNGRILVKLAGIDQTLPSSISIIGLNGTIVKKIAPVSDSNEIDLSDKADGVYVLVISANDKSIKWQVVKQ